MSRIREERRACGLCVMCGKNGVVDCTECEVCKLKRSEREKEKYKNKYAAIKKQRREEAVSRGLCSRCNLYCGQKNCDSCLEKQRRRTQKMKDAVFAKYGGYICKCCGETIKEFLTLDHKNDDGAAHRRLLGKGICHLYRWIVRNDFPAIFQVMCFNCNCGRRFNNGVCPHHRNRTASV